MITFNAGHDRIFTESSGARGRQVLSGGLNVGLLNCALGIEGEIVRLVHERSTAGLDAGEIDLNIRTVAAYSDTLDDTLACDLKAILFCRVQEFSARVGDATADYTRGFPLVAGGELRRKPGGERPSFNFECRVDPDDRRRELQADDWNIQDDVFPENEGALLVVGSR